MGMDAGLKSSHLELDTVLRDRPARRGFRTYRLNGIKFTYRYFASEFGAEQRTAHDFHDLFVFQLRKLLEFYWHGWRW